MSDFRVEEIFREAMKGDTSFQNGANILTMMFPTRYSSAEMRETWDSGIKHGIEIGLRRSTPQGQRIELNNNTQDERHQEFIKKFYELAGEYNCQISYHPSMGMTIRDLNNKR